MTRLEGIRMRLFSLSTTVLLCCLICIGFSSTLNAQSGSRAGASTKPGDPKTSQAKDKQFAEKFWNYLLSNNYKHWSPPAGKSADHFSSQTVGIDGAQSPHGTNVKMYVNRTAASNPDQLPVGSVLIMENYRQDKSLETISVMYRTPGFNPSGNDWYWINYNPDGSITSVQRDGMISSLGRNGVSQASAAAPLPRKKLVGRSQTCIQCHKSGGSDLAFFNNRIGTRTAKAEPFFQKPTTEADSAFRKKLKVQPAATLKQGAQQNFNLLLQPETVISGSP